MSIEKITPEEDLQKQTIDAVREGTALPTPEGLRDPEIVQAFKDRLDGMSAEEFENFSDEFQQLSSEVMDEIKNGDGKITSVFLSTRGNKLIKHLATYFSMATAASAGAALVIGKPELALLATLSSLYMGFQAIDSATREQIGIENLDKVKRNVEPLLETLKQAANEREDSDYLVDNKQ